MSRSSAAIWRLRAALLVLWAERLGIALWSGISLAALLAALALAGVPPLLPSGLHVALLVVAAIAIVFLVRRNWRRTARPVLSLAERRLERDSGLRHRPFAVLRDQPASPGAPETALWQLHRQRAIASLAQLRLRGPDPHLAAHDPFALRAGAALLLVAGLVIAGPQAGNRLAGLFAPGMSGWRGGASPVVQAWIQPPAYTGLPPVFLPPPGHASGVVTVPSGSRLTISISGLAARPDISLAGVTQHIDSLGNDSFQSALTLTEPGHLRIGTFFSDLAAWDLALLPNEKPVVAWASLPGRAGTSQSTKLPWQVQQRWGVAALQAEMRPQGHPELPSLTVPLPLPGTPKQAKGAATPDLSSNPYAGLTLTARLAARDVSGQQGISDPADFVLPARNFHHPMARAIADLRRRLALHPNLPDDAAADIAALAQAPYAANDPSGVPASAVILNLSAAAALLTETPTAPANVAEAQARLWTLALALDGVLPDPSARALAEARDKLRHALEDRAAGRLSQKDLDNRLDALREALDKRLADIARQAMQKGAIEKFDPHTQHLSSSAMDRLIRKLQQAVQEGRMDEARERMAQLEKMLDQLKSAQIMSRQDARRQQEQSRRGRQMMGAVQDLVQRETALLDHAQTRAPAELPGLPPPFRTFEFPPSNGTEEPPQDEPAPPMSGLPPDDSVPAEPPDRSPPGDHADRQTTPAQTRAHSQADDARIQRALHRALEAMSQAFVESGGKKPHNLDDAGHAMDDAAQALAHRQDPAARDAIQRAIAALQQGGQSMAQQMTSPSGGQMQLSLQPGAQAGQGEDGQEGNDEPDDGQGGRKKDPFGRQVDGNGTVADDPNLRVPDEMEQGRSRAIQEELRRRGADRQRPQEELNYIERLLKPF